VLALAVGMTGRIAVAAPRAAIAELRAIACCVTHCPEGPRPARAPHRCCAIGSDANAPASQAAAPSLERPAAPPLASLAPMPPLAVALGTLVRRELVMLRAGPPALLATQKLRC
jgi:hypothetical protein